MFCENCGHQIPDGARFCDSCGAPVGGREAAAPGKKTGPAGNAGNAGHAGNAGNAGPAGNAGNAGYAGNAGNAGYAGYAGNAGPMSGGYENGAPLTGEKVTENIYRCPDGKYRWIYEYQMLKNPAILITVLKALTLSFAIVMGLMFLFNLIGGDFRYWDAGDFVSFYGGFLILLLVMLALGVIAYLILAASYGWTYQVLLTMDEEGVELRQMRKDFEKTQAIGWLAAAAGLAGGNLGGAGAGVLAATRDSSVSVFRQVRKVKAMPGRHVIYVNQTLGHNQVYAEDADFAFVRDFIVRHCPNAVIQG